MEDNESRPEPSRPPEHDAEVDAALNRLGELRKESSPEDPQSALWNRNFVLAIVGIVLLAGVGLWLILLSGPHADASETLDCPTFLITLHGNPERSFTAEGCGRAQPFRCDEGSCYPTDEPREAGENCCGDGAGWRTVD